MWYKPFSDAKYLQINKKRGFIFALLVVEDKDLNDTADEGCNQIIEKIYLKGEKVCGYQYIVDYEIAFDKKRCFIKMNKEELFHIL